MVNIYSSRTLHIKPTIPISLSPFQCPSVPPLIRRIDYSLLDKLFLFELTMFSFLTGNNDMHLKNFSMLRSDPGWLLAPAFDLLNVVIVNPDDKEELALTLQGKKSNLKRINFETFGKGLGLTERQIQGAFNRFYDKKKDALQWINRSFLSSNMGEKYKDMLNERYGRVFE